MIKCADAFLTGSDKVNCFNNFDRFENKHHHVNAPSDEY